LEKEALVHELSTMVDSLQKQVVQLQQKPQEYADYWINSESKEMQLDDDDMKVEETESVQAQSELDFWSSGISFI
jgi:antibiotic biosynthesis monooxygenase (ABM) superfamily enzyme